MNLDLKVYGELKTFAAFRDDGAELGVQVMSTGNGLGPVERQDGCGNDLALLAMGIDGEFACAEGFLPDAAMSRPDQRTELEIQSGGILRDKSHIGFHDGDLALFHDKHRDEFHTDEEGIEVIGAIKERIMLKTDAAAVVEEQLEILIII
ncbi:MAG TPA: hypothetical protein PLB62_13775, partial [Candidatus Sumerlaeota bacterium]|nr:hypothetical protein [Candidatus Sumerlaeota bacterium]